MSVHPFYFIQYIINIHSYCGFRQRFIPTHAGMKSIPILTQLSKCWDFLWDFRFNDVIPRSRDLIFFQSQIFSVKHVPCHNKYIFMYWLYTQKIKVSWIMPDEAKKLNFFIMWCTNYQLITSSTSDIQIKTDRWICSGQVLCQVSWIIKNLLREFWGDTYSFVLMDIVWIYMDIMKLMPITTRQDLVADGFLHRTAVAKSLAFL